MEITEQKNDFLNQLSVVTGVLSLILSCGLGLENQTFNRDYNNNDTYTGVDEASARLLETAGDIAFVPSIILIPITMQKKGRRIATLATVLPLTISWLLSFDSHFFSALVVSVLYNFSLGGAVTVSSIVISEYCSPKYRGSFLMLETAMISLGVLLGHLSGTLYLNLISSFGLLTSVYSLIIVYFWPESPYWLISQGHLVKGTESFQWLRGDDEDAFKELDSIMKTQRLKLQLEALRPIRKVGIKETAVSYLKSLISADFLKPLSIMILLFSFVGFSGENAISGYSFRDIFKLTNGKYIGTIILDVLTLICSITACILIQIVKRNTLFVFTGSFSIIFMSLASVILFLQSIELFSKDYTWVFLSFVTGFVMFMSLGTTALPFSLIGEIFPMSYKGIGSSLTCAYLWAFGNSMVTLMPTLSKILGIHGFLFLLIILMSLILILLSKLMPDTNCKTLVEIEKIIKFDKKDDDYNSVTLNDDEELDSFDKLKLFIEV